MTDFSCGLIFLNNVIKKRSTCFLITDCFGRFDDSLQIVARKHDMCAVLVNDAGEYELPEMGMVQFKDTETGQTLWIDTDSRATREAFAMERRTREEENIAKLNKYGVDTVKVLCGEDYIKQLTKLFAMR